MTTQCRYVFTTQNHVNDPVTLRTFWKQKGIARIPTPMMLLARVTTFVESGPILARTGSLKQNTQRKQTESWL